MVELRGWLREKKAALLSVVPLVAISVLGSVYFNHPDLSSSVNSSFSVEAAPQVPDEPLFFDGAYEVDKGYEYVFLKGMFTDWEEDRYTAVPLTLNQKEYILTLLERGVELSKKAGAEKPRFPVEIFVSPVHDKRVHNKARDNDHASAFIIYNFVTGLPERCTIRIPGYILPVDFFINPDKPIPQQSKKYTDSVAFTLGWHEPRHCNGYDHGPKPRFVREKKIQRELGVTDMSYLDAAETPLTTHRDDLAWWDISLNTASSINSVTAMSINSITD